MSILFVIALVWVAVKMLIWGIKATWGIAKVLAMTILFPLLILEFAVVGLFYIALPLLIIAMIIATIGGRASA